MHLIVLALMLLQAPQTAPLLDNEFVRVFKNSAPCAMGTPQCGERIVVALGPVELGGRKLKRGDTKVFRAGQGYAPPNSGEYLEVAVNPAHPKAMKSDVQLPPLPYNKVVYDDERITIIQENLEPGVSSTEHSHDQRLVITINAARVQQSSNGKSESRDLVPNNVQLRPPVVHSSTNVGKIPILNLLIHFKP
jgi:hypothetical protein